MPDTPLLVMLRCPPEEIQRLDTLFGFSIQRALWALESAASAAARLAVTRAVITPLERERLNLQQAAVRCQGGGGRLLLPRSTVELIERQWRSLCQVATRAEFDSGLLPPALGDPFCGHRAFQKARGLGPTPIERPARPPARGAGTH